MSERKQGCFQHSLWPPNKQSLASDSWPGPRFAGDGRNPDSSYFLLVYLFWGEGKKLNKNSCTVGIEAAQCFLLRRLSARNLWSETWLLNNLEVDWSVTITALFLECTLKCYQLNCGLGAWMPLLRWLGQSGLLSRTSYWPFPAIEMCLHSERAQIDADRTLAGHRTSCIRKSSLFTKWRYLVSSCKVWFVFFTVTIAAALLG